MCNYELVRLSDNEQQQYVLCGDSNNAAASIVEGKTTVTVGVLFI